MTVIEVENKAMRISAAVRTTAKLRRIMNKVETGRFFRKLRCYAYAEIVRRRNRK